MKYKGNNIGLSFDGTGWSFTNTAQDYIDTSAFSSPDPAFPIATTPESPETEEPENDPCPPGYKYDNRLKQCVPDPEFQNPFLEQNEVRGGGDSNPVQIPGTNRFTTDDNFIATDAEYEAMTPKELIENYQARGYVKKNEQGNLVVDLNRMLGTKLFDAALSRVGQGGETQARKKKLFKFLMDKGLVDSKLNPNVFNFYPTGGQPITSDNFPVTRLTGETGEIVLPKYLSSTVDTAFSGPNMADVAGGTLKVEDVGTKVSNFSNAALNKVITDVKTVSDTKEQAEIAKAMAEADKARAEADAARLKVEGFVPGEDTQQQQKTKEQFVQFSQAQGKSKSEAERDYNRTLAREALRKAEAPTTGTGQLLGTAFDKDVETTPSGKSYTQSKLEEAAKTGIFKGF